MVTCSKGMSFQGEGCDRCNHPEVSELMDKCKQRAPQFNLQKRQLLDGANRIFENGSDKNVVPADTEVDGSRLEGQLEIQLGWLMKK